jgi:hypothetical protein
VGRSPRRVGPLGLPRLGIEPPLCCLGVHGAIAAPEESEVESQWVVLVLVLVLGLLVVVVLGSCLQARMG